MCGIFGYIGKRDASQTILEGLKRLEYRGYDSWGIAVRHDDEIKVTKNIGEIGHIEKLDEIDGAFIGVGHTRWATHGGVTEINAHPHFSTDKSFIVAQNGIVENYQELKKMLIEKGYSFVSETDTEVIVRLIEEYKKSYDNLRDAVRMAFLDLAGRNTIIVLDSKGEDIVSVRNGSPLVVGIGNEDSPEFFFASDTLSFADKTDKVVFLSDFHMAEVKDNNLKVYDVKTGDEIKFEVKTLDHDDVTIDKEGFDHFMIKEIVEQKHTIREAAGYSQEELKPLVDAIKNADTIYTVGAGTASFAAGQIAYFLRKHGKVRAIELKAYEMGSYKELFTDKDLMIAVSQSGETADTIEALEFAKNKGAKIASIVNMVGSSITRMSDFAYLSRSGPEICVASTKAFTAQITWGLMLAMSVADKYEESKEDILKLSEQLSKYFSEELFSQIKEIAKKLKDKEHFFVLGKGQNYYVAIEGALKIKEITYKHFEGFAAGELKHGVIALIDKGTPVFGIVSDDEHKADILTALAEVKARGAYIIAVGKENNELFDDFIKSVDGGLLDSAANVIPFQLISYFLGVELGNSPDKPRNLAKSVTVK